MASEHKIAVEIWAKDGDLDVANPDLSFEDGEVDFVSFVNHDTYGIPPLIAGTEGRPATARTEDKVLYVNPGEMFAMTIEKVT